MGDGVPVTPFSHGLRSTSVQPRSSAQKSRAPSIASLQALDRSIASALQIEDQSAQRVASLRAIAALNSGSNLASCLGIPDAGEKLQQVASNAHRVRAEVADAKCLLSSDLDSDITLTCTQWNSSSASDFEAILTRAGHARSHALASDAAYSHLETQGQSPLRSQKSGDGAQSFSPDWLRKRCSMLPSVIAGALAAPEVALSVLSLLSAQNRSAEDVQSDLFDSLQGDFDAVADVLAHRIQIMHHADAVFADCTQAIELTNLNQHDLHTSSSSRHFAASSSRRRPRPEQSLSSRTNSNYTVTDTAEIALEKQRKSLERHMGIAPSNLENGAGFNGLDEEEPVFLRNLGGSAVEELRKAFPGIELDGERAIGDVERIGLPKGAMRHVRKGYEEIFIPPPEPKSNVKTNILIDVASAFQHHPELLQALKGVKTFNRLQSAVFPTAFDTDENLLVCAPTGAGKTNVALLTIFQQIVSVKKGTQQNFKIVYVAPMKALAAEVVEKFGAKLEPLGLKVREFTGDMSLTRRETIETHVLVTTPEKWDVVTRKSGSILSSLITLFIVDEIHLLHDDRGAVLESIIARTLRLQESAQRKIRLVGLSATLPNYVDVASFLRVKREKGLFFFDSGHRPVPLSQTFIGVSEGGTSASKESRRKREAKFTELAWEKVKDSLQRGHQAMVFVHSRKETSTTARDLLGIAAQDQVGDLLLGGEPKSSEEIGSDTPGESEAKRVLPTWAAREIGKSRTADIRELCSKGIGIHNAGLPRPDRKLVEKLFAEGILRVLCCTATLAWGVNLPARTVVIKGTDVYNAEKGGFEQLGMLDVMQIFGRAGRPQFDTEGEGTIITKHENLSKYLNLLTAAVPIESTLGASASRLADHLNAEVVSGTVTSIGEGVKWLSYTYLSVRMPQNPLIYGIDWAEVAADPDLHSRRATLVEQAAKALDDARMCRYDPRTGSIASTDLGRVCSHFYVSHRTVVLWNEILDNMSGSEYQVDTVIGMEKLYAAVLEAVSCASEFEQMRSREEESKELESLVRHACPIRQKHGSETREGKVSILLQGYISRAQIRMSDLSYIVQSSTRLLRALFEISLRRGLQGLSLAALELARASECQIWPFQHPLLQFSYHAKKGSGFVLPAEVIANLEEQGPSGTLQHLRELDNEGLSNIVRFPRTLQVLKRTIRAIPLLEVTKASVGPVTRSLLRFSIELQPLFRWNDALHGNFESWWLWIEDREEGRIYHSERIVLGKSQVQEFNEVKNKIESTRGHHEPGVKGKMLLRERVGLELEILVPVFDPPSPEYWIKVESEHWHTGGGSSQCLKLDDMVLPQKDPPQTNLLDLRPLPINAALPLHFAETFRGSLFTHFNPIQTQVFHALYHSDENVLVAMPLGSGKTLLAELAIFRGLLNYPKKSVVYLAPHGDLVSKRARDWKSRFNSNLAESIVELHNADQDDIRYSDSLEHLRRAIVLATPTAWQAVSRGWTSNDFERTVSTVIVDDVHYVGEDSGHDLEAAISRIRYLSEAHVIVGGSDSASSKGLQRGKVRMICLSAPLANPMELASWLGVDPQRFLFNFRPTSRPVPCECHLLGVAEEMYAPRMQSMNRLVYSSILKYASRGNALVFAASQRQARLTARDLARFSAIDDKPLQFALSQNRGTTGSANLSSISDSSLRVLLRSGIGVLHSGQSEKDREVMENLFRGGAITVLVATFDFAWKINVRASLVVIKGTEKFHGEKDRHIDVGVAHILQMIGRAGRPQTDTQCYAVVLAQERKKSLLKKFLYSPLPVESHIVRNLGDHLLQQMASGAISTSQDCLDFLSWTYLLRRIVMNPSMYGVVLESAKRETAQNRGHERRKTQITSKDVESFCSRIVMESLSELWFDNGIEVKVTKSRKGTVKGAARSVEAGIAEKEERAVGDKESSSPNLSLSSLGWICVRNKVNIRQAREILRQLEQVSSITDAINFACRHVVKETSDLAVNEHLSQRILNSIPSLYLKSLEQCDRQTQFDKSEITEKLGSIEGSARLLIHGCFAGVEVKGSEHGEFLRTLTRTVFKWARVAIVIAAEGGMLRPVQMLIHLLQSFSQRYLPSTPVAILFRDEQGSASNKFLREIENMSISMLLGNRKRTNEQLSSEDRNSGFRKGLQQLLATTPVIAITDCSVISQEDGVTLKVTLKRNWSSEVDKRLALQKLFMNDASSFAEIFYLLVVDESEKTLFALREFELRDQNALETRDTIFIKLPEALNAKQPIAGQTVNVLLMPRCFVGIDQMKSVVLTIPQGS